MKNFGFKIVDQSRDSIEPLVTRCLLERRPLEVGLYFGMPEVLKFLGERLRESGLRVAAHLDHRRLSIFHLERRGPDLCEQLALAERLGASFVITHLSPDPMTLRPDKREALLDRLSAGLGFARRVCQDYGLDLHIENTYHGVAFYRWFHEGISTRGIRDIHVCFDIGHAKVWSTDSLQGWLELLADLSDRGRRLHFHLHANRGLSDEHLSFVEAERLGITAADGFTVNLDYYQALGVIAHRFPSATKVFEVPAAEAEENLDHVLDRIETVQARSLPLQACRDELWAFPKANSPKE